MEKPDYLKSPFRLYKYNCDFKCHFVPDRLNQHRMYIYTQRQGKVVKVNTRNSKVLSQISSSKNLRLFNSENNLLSLSGGCSERVTLDTNL